MGCCNAFQVTIPAAREEAGFLLLDGHALLRISSVAQRKLYQWHISHMGLM